MSHTFFLPIKVLPEDIDELNHVNNIVYLLYVQDAAIGHWKTVPQEIASQIIWVARRHEIDYLKPAFLNDEHGLFIKAKKTKKLSQFCGWKNKII